MQKQKTYFQGDRAEYTGRKEKLYGGLFSEIRLLEGPNKGKIRLVKAIREREVIK